jgi:toxin ParE1/3/4
MTKLMPSYQLTPDAQADLIEIRRYTLTQWGASQSQKYLSDLRKTLKLLAATPTLGKSRPEITAGAFSFPYISHVIYYLHEGETIWVFAVLHKRMVPFAHLAHRELPSTINS